MLSDIAPAQQLLQGIGANLEVTLTDAVGAPAAGLTVTVAVTRADGTTVASGNAVDAKDGLYTFALTATQLSLLDVLIAAWTVSSVVRATTAHEVVGGFYYGEGDVAAAEAGRAANDGEPFATIRREVECECERMTWAAFVPRYSRYLVDGPGDDVLILPDSDIRTVRDVQILGADGTFTAMDAATLTLLQPHRAGMVARPVAGSGNLNTFPAGLQNILIGYEHGMDRPPPDLRRAAIRRHRARSNAAKSGVPDRAISWAAENGATYRIATPDRYSTGDPTVDAAYEGYSRERPVFG